MTEPLTADARRRETARRRRRGVIDDLSRELDLRNPTSAAARFLRVLEEPTARDMIVSADIDGLVSATMLSHVTGWTAPVLVVKTAIYVHPDVVTAGLPLDHIFGVDVFSSRFPNVSNHVALYGPKRPESNATAAAMAVAHDTELLRRSESMLFLNPNVWSRIEGAYPSDANRPRSAMYRYPLGAAQVLLALLEVVGRSPRLFDREYLPWLVANCDGGLDSFRKYAYNVPLWWSCLAAAVGPASLSEQLYRVASEQRPTQFLDVVNQLRAEDRSGVAAHLDGDWNLTTQGTANIGPVIAWLSDISGWPDPIRGGADNLSDWVRLTPATGKVLVSGLPAAPTIDERLEAFRHHLVQSLTAVHTNFAYYDQAQALNWVLAPDELRFPLMDDLLSPLGAPHAQSVPPADLWSTKET